MSQFKQRGMPEREEQRQTPPKTAISYARLDSLIKTHVPSLAIFREDEQTEIGGSIREVAQERASSKKGQKRAELLGDINAAIVGAAGSHDRKGRDRDSVGEIRSIVFGFGKRSSLDFGWMGATGISSDREQAKEYWCKISSAMVTIRADLKIRMKELKLEGSLDELLSYLGDSTASSNATLPMKKYGFDSLVAFASYAKQVTEDRLNGEFGSYIVRMEDFLAQFEKNGWPTGTITFQDLKEAVGMIGSIERIHTDCSEFLDKAASGRGWRNVGSRGEKEAKATAEKILGIHESFSACLDRAMRVRGYDNLTQEQLIGLIRNGTIDRDMVRDGSSMIKVKHLEEIALYAITRISDITDDGRYSDDVGTLMEFYHGVQARRWGGRNPPPDGEQYPDAARALKKVPEMKALKDDCMAFIERINRRNRMF